MINTTSIMPGKRRLLLGTVLLFLAQMAFAQTDADAIMMAKNNFCVGGMYNYSSWTNYWEVTLKRHTPNLGRVSTQMIGVMGTYGISKKLNILAEIPYVKTHSSA